MKAAESEVPPDIDFQIPAWAGKAPTGTHLDVYKGDKLLQKLMIDEKRCYFFGRNPQLCDIAVEHASCSRVHSALLYHKHLNRCFLIDLDSAHGTFISNVKLEGSKPEQLQFDQIFRFGASTRRYILREKPTSGFYTLNQNSNEISKMKNDTKSANNFLTLPEKEEELENLTEYNTALNRRIAAMNVPEENFSHFKRRRTANVIFKDEEEVINPEDIDPNIGKFRNLVQTAVISTKRPKFGNDHYNLAALNTPHSLHTPAHSAMGHHHHPDSVGGPSSGGGHPSTAVSKLGLPISLNIAPEIELYPASMFEESAPQPDQSGLVAKRAISHAEIDAHDYEDDANCPKKKKYAKEAWPGKKPGQGLLM